MAGRNPCLNCRRPTSSGPYCDDCRPAYGHDSRLYRQRVRPAVLERDGHECRLVVDDDCTRVATTVHRLPEYGPEHDGDLDAYLSACAHCHGVTDAPRAGRPNGGRARSRGVSDRARP